MKKFFTFFLVGMSVITQADSNAEKKIDEVKILEAEFGACHIKIADPFKGRLRTHNDEKPPMAIYRGPLYQIKEGQNNFSFQMWCEKANEETLKGCGVSLKNGKLNTTNAEGLTEKDLKLLNQQRIILKGINWDGAGYSEDQINGDPDLRIRSFHFCAVYDNKTIYGRAESIAHLITPQETALPNLIKLLEGLEFIDDTPTQ